MKIKIAGTYWENFNNFTLSTSIDSVASTWALLVRFDPDNPEHRELFRPLSFKLIEFFNDDGTVFSTGKIVTHDFIASDKPELVQISGYSLGGVLEDCEIPYEAYPLESLNRSLKQITERLLKYFGLKLVVYASAAKACNENIAKSVAEPTEKVKEYLSKISAQKNVVFSHDVHGNLIFFKPDLKAKSKYFFEPTDTIRMGLVVNGQAFHSKLTTLRQATSDEKYASDESGRQLTAAETITNKLVTDYRPFVSVLTSGAIIDTTNGVKNARATELKNIQVTVSTTDWIPGVSIGDIVEIQNPWIYFPEKTRMLVYNTILDEDSKGKSMTLSLVLPETFSDGDTAFKF